MTWPSIAPSIWLARETDGQIELVEWNRFGDIVQIITETEETVIACADCFAAWDDLADRGFVEVLPTDRRKLEAERDRILALVRTTFHGVTLGNGIGLLQAQGIDNYADRETLAAYRAQDEKEDWSAIPVAALDGGYSSLSFFDADGMRFHLPAYLIADLEDSLQVDDLQFHLTYPGFDGFPGFDRFSTLSRDQRAAVRQFLLLRLSDYNYEFSHRMIEGALETYWTAEPES